MTLTTPRLRAVIEEIDRANAADPRHDVVDGTARPREAVYSERMTRTLLELYPAASEALQIAARAQHICRWQVPRDRYPLGRDGYNAWRSAARDHHAALARAIMGQHGFAEAEIRHVSDLIGKKRIKSDPESQALENVVGVVFVRHYLDEFVQGHADYDAERLLGILTRTFRKMDALGHQAVLGLEMPEALAGMIRSAMP